MLPLRYVLLFVMAFGLKCTATESVKPCTVFLDGFQSPHFKGTSAFKIPASVKDLYCTFVISDAAGETQNKERTKIYLFTAQGNFVDHFTRSILKQHRHFSSNYNPKRLLSGEHYGLYICHGLSFRISPILVLDHHWTFLVSALMSLVLTLLCSPVSQLHDVK